MSMQDTVQKLAGVLERFTFGVELETVENPYDNIRRAMERLNWDTHTDSSVGSGGGYEAVSPPMSIVGYREEHLPFIKESLVRYIEPTQTAGLHVHVGINNLPLKRSEKVGLIKNIANFWLAHDDYITDVLAKRLYSRRNWCYKLAYGNFHDRVKQAINSGETVSEIASQMDNRYRTMNLTALNKYGTVEFRVFNSTKDPAYIQSAIEFSVAVVAYALAVLKFPEDFSQDLLSFDQFKEFRWAMHDFFAGNVQVRMSDVASTN